MSSALVLGGGTMKGAFQAGALTEILKKFTPDAIYGVSVGALNGAFLADRAGRRVRAGQPVDWPAIADELVDFWKTEITGFDRLGKRRTKTSVGWNVLVGNFNGLTTMAPLEALLAKTIDRDNIAASGVNFQAGAVNMIDGEFVSASVAMPHFFKYVVGSAMSPIIMPLQVVDEKEVVLVDGGVRNIAPLSQAIKDRAGRVVCIACQPQRLSPASLDRKSLFAVVERLMDIVSNELINEDLEWAGYINAFCPEDGSARTEEPFRGCRKIDLRVIRPLVDLRVPLEKFTPKDIADTIEIGRLTALQELVVRPL